MWGLPSAPILSRPPSWPWQPISRACVQAAADLYQQSGAFERGTEQHIHPALGLSFSQAECRADGCGCPPVTGWSDLPLLSCYSPLCPFYLFFNSPSPIRATRRMQWSGFLQLAVQEPLRCSVRCRLPWLIASEVAAPLLKKLRAIFL